MILFLKTTCGQVSFLLKLSFPIATCQNTSEADVF